MHIWNNDLAMFMKLLLTLLEYWCTIPGKLKFDRIRTFAEPCEFQVPSNPNIRQFLPEVWPNIWPNHARSLNVLDKCALTPQLKFKFSLLQKSDKKGDAELKPVKEVEIKASDKENKNETGCIIS